ncbi:hypothetical protein [Novosphingobium aquimarinum]|uniref:hypothetical protein n=1 Tax=Novosphingobium aquimarinum TaxID=2682494 RepID=UPI0012EC12BC|nr:hypothetical protein [Novosphingobium aquimarinum]
MNNSTRGFFGAVVAMLMLSNFGWQGLLLCLPILLAVPIVADGIARLSRRGTNTAR